MQTLPTIIPNQQNSQLHAIKFYCNNRKTKSRCNRHRGKSRQTEVCLFTLAGNKQECNYPIVPATREQKIENFMTDSEKKRTKIDVNSICLLHRSQHVAAPEKRIRIMLKIRKVDKDKM